jgi:bifunctional non-homologous end joining protein LigD
VIGGWAESDKSRSFRSLLFGAYNQNGEFEWIGRSGGGYKQGEMPGILNELQKLEIEKTPFINKVLDTKGAKTHWVKPELVANLSSQPGRKVGGFANPQPSWASAWIKKQIPWYVKCRSPTSRKQL